MPEASTANEQWVGQGRSAVVYLGHDQQGRPIARKVFTGDGASKLVLYVLTGSANPYTWCKSAMHCAVIRRRILSRLVRVWFGERMRLPRHDGWGWNAHYRAFELRSELIDGHHAPLRGPEYAGQIDYLSELVEGVMKPLQQHLTESGFDGLVWQAGKGNPVASNNFMMERGTMDEPRWVWIDLESGVPALFAMNPLATLCYYLPKSVHHRRWLFDDVDAPKLQTYILDNESRIVEALGSEACQSLQQDVAELELQQDAWRSIKRYQRNIAYEHARGRLSDEQAEWYHARPVRWYARMIPDVTVRAIAAVRRKASRVANWVQTFPFGQTARRSLRYVASSRFRWGVARWAVARSIKSWVQRGYLDSATAYRLRRELKHDEASAYLTDFSLHLCIKPVVKTMQWGVLPALWIGGVISEVTFGLILVMGGPIGRTLYTSWRMMQAAFMRQRLPWVALLIGVFPVIGNVAYPMQLLHSSTGNSGGLARFIVYDIAAKIGRAIPIWGGSDSQVEHFFNRAGDVTVRTLMQAMSKGPELRAAS